MAACNTCIYGVSSDQQEDKMVFHRISLASDRDRDNSQFILNIRKRGSFSDFPVNVKSKKVFT